MKKLYSVFLFLCMTSFLSAQTTVTGKITDKDGSLLAGVSVVLKGTTKGTASGNDGEFALKTSSQESILVFSFIGMKTQEVKVGDKTTFDIVMEVDNEMMDEVTVVGFSNPNVFARKRLEKLQDVPETVTAFSAKDIEESGASQTMDLLNNVSNMNVRSYLSSGVMEISMRGITQARSVEEAPVALVIDGFTIASPKAFNQDLLGDVELLEVIKGPQGALFGRNAIAGAINIVTKKPSGDTEGFARLRYGNYNSMKIAGGVSTALIEDKLSVRLGGGFTKRDGFFQGEYIGEPVDPYQDASMRMALDFNVSERFKISMVNHVSDMNAAAPVWFYVYTPNSENADQMYNLPQNPSDKGSNKRDLFSSSLKMQYVFPEVGTLEFTGTYCYLYEDWTGDSDRTPEDWTTGWRQLTNKSMPLEMKFVSEGDKKLRWLLGTFYMPITQDYDSHFKMNMASDSVVNFGQTPNPALGEILLSQTHSTDENHTLAFFGQANYDVTDNLEFTLGLRYDNDYREQTNRTVRRDSLGNILDPIFKSTTFTKFQPKVTAKYKFSENTMSFFTFSQGFRSGGFNAVEHELFDPIFDAEFSTNYELGWKSSFWDNRIIFNASLFHIDYQNQQFTLYIFSPTGGGGDGAISIDKTQINGFEMDFKIRPAKGLDIITGLGLMDFEITEYARNPEFVGRKTPYTSDNSFNGIVQYTLPLGKKDDSFALTARASVNHKGEQFWYMDNEDTQEAYQLYNAKLTFRNSKYTVTLWTDNLTDTKYNSYFAPAQSVGYPRDFGYPSPPRTFGIDLGVKF